MIFFKKNYFSLFFKNTSCEICIKHSNKKLPNICKDINFYDKEELKQSIKNEIHSVKKLKKILICDFYEQFFKEEKSDFFVDEFGGKKFLISNQKLQNFIDEIDINFDEIHSSFTLLNELANTKQSEKPTLFILPFANSICYIIKQNNAILFAKMLEINNDFMDMLAEPKFANLSFDKFEDIVFINLLYGIYKFFNYEISNLIEKIYIFNDEILNEGAVYLLYTKTLIQTELIPLKMSEKICEIFSKGK